MKLVINRCWGGFSISRAAAEYMAARGHEDATDALERKGGPAGWFGFICRAHELRTHPLLVEAVEVLGNQANGEHAVLKVIEIPDDVEWYINDYDGMETVHEVHRTWS